MIPQITLDDETFSEIMEGAVKRISELLPEWTDHNSHDPGITLLELSAWLIEMQQFHLDQIGEQHIKKFYKHLGAGQKPVQPAKAQIELTGIQTPGYILEDSRFYAGNICFETNETRFLDKAVIKKLVSTEGGEAGGGRKYEALTDGRNLHFPAFGESPKAGSSLWLGFDAPLVPKVEHRLSLFFSDTPMMRNPIGEGADDFVPPARYLVTYPTVKGGKQALALNDTTYRMIEDGYLAFVIEGQMLPGGDGLYWLRITLEDCEYDMAPVIEEAGLSHLDVSQRRTLAKMQEVCIGKGKCIHSRTALAGEKTAELYIEQGAYFVRYTGEILTQREADGWRFDFPELDANAPVCGVLVCYDAKYKDRMFVGMGNGLPHQEYPIWIDGLCRDGMIIFAETKEGSGRYERWEERSDLSASSPDDRHFCWDEAMGRLRFGDCIHGRAPRGAIFLVMAHTSFGAAGNVKAESIDCAGYPYAASCKNGRDAFGGADAETLEQCRIRLSKQRNECVRAVTFEDYETLVRRTPGLMIENVRAVPIDALPGGTEPDRDGVAVIVKPYGSGHDTVLSDTYRRNIWNMLEPKRLVGTRIEIFAPEYIGISIFADITVTIQSDQARAFVVQILTDYFEEIRADFGVCIPYSTIYGKMDVLGFVTEIKSLSVDAQGNNVRRSRNGDILLPVNGLAYLKECSIC